MKSKTGFRSRNPVLKAIRSLLLLFRLRVLGKIVSRQLLVILEELGPFLDVLDGRNEDIRYVPVKSVVIESEADDVVLLLGGKAGEVSKLIVLQMLLVALDKDADKKLLRMIGIQNELLEEVHRKSGIDDVFDDDDGLSLEVMTGSF